MAVKGLRSICVDEFTIEKTSLFNGIIGLYVGVLVRVIVENIIHRQQSRTYVSNLTRSYLVSPPSCRLGRLYSLDNILTVAPAAVGLVRDVRVPRACDATNGN